MNYPFKTCLGHPQIKFCHLLTLILFETCLTLCFLYSHHISSLKRTIKVINGAECHWFSCITWSVVTPVIRICGNAKVNIHFSECFLSILQKSYGAFLSLPTHSNFMLLLQGKEQLQFFPLHFLGKKSYRFELTWVNYSFKKFQISQWMFFKGIVKAKQMNNIAHSSRLSTSWSH